MVCGQTLSAWLAFSFFKQKRLTFETLPKKSRSDPSRHVCIAHTAAWSAFPNTWKSSGNANICMGFGDGFPPISNCPGLWPELLAQLLGSPRGASSCARPRGLRATFLVALAACPS